MATIRRMICHEDADEDGEVWVAYPDLPPEVVIEDVWVCPWCVHLNPMRERACEECGNPNPDKPW